MNDIDVGQIIFLANLLLLTFHLQLEHINGVLDGFLLKSSPSVFSCFLNVIFLHHASSISSSSTSVFTLCKHQSGKCSSCNHIAIIFFRYCLICFEMLCNLCTVPSFDLLLLNYHIWKWQNMFVGCAGLG